ncbi:MAG TPA: discoidin domain-containing protein [Sedimentisphaerales bacterium]|nr:discoidin domain-containing protein [Sedimentisphaerales bacterium]
MNKKLVCLMAALSLAGATLASAASPGPVSWWKLDEMSGTVTVDAVGGGQGILSGDPVWIPGKIDGALSFDGDDDFVTLPIGELISTLSDVTITTWADFSNSGGAWQRIWDFGSGSGNNPYMFLCARVGTSGVVRFAIRTATIGEQVVNTPDRLASGWHNVAVSINSQTMRSSVYMDGVMVASGATLVLPKDLGVTTQNWLGKSQWPDALYKGSLDDMRIYDRVLTTDEIVNAMDGGLGYGIANTPVPANMATNLLPNVVLSWKPGQESKTYDVYFGTNRDVVLAATTANPMGVLVSAGQDELTFDVGRLAFGTTYYWRVDGIGAEPAFEVYKGNVWSFTVEPYAYTLGKAAIKATASSVNNSTMGPEKTIDGSGLNPADEHSTVETDMWLSAKGGPEPVWIQYEFDKVYSLNEMLVWNSNQAMEPVVGYGLMNVEVQYSQDGQTWVTLDTLDFAQAPGEPGYKANTTVDFGGAPAKFVKLVVNSNWGGFLPQYGLSEVRFTYIPVTATAPSPASGTVELTGPVTLSWRPGREVVSHEVFMGTDPADLTLVATVDAPTYVAEVELDKTYYWQVVEVNEDAATARWASPVWMFKTKELPKDPGVMALAALYAMEDNIDDSSGNGLNGTLTNGPTFVDSMAGMGKALSFDGTDDYATLPIGELMSTLSDITVATWANYAGTGGSWQRLFDFGSGTSAYLFLSPNGGGSQMRVALRTATVGEQIVNGPRALPTGWHHVAVTIDSATKTMKLYLDGELAGSGATSLLPKDMGVTTQNWIAKSQYAADAYFKGVVDDFRIYNKALSKGEIMYLAGQR